MAIRISYEFWYARLVKVCNLEIIKMKSAFNKALELISLFVEFIHILIKMKKDGDFIPYDKIKKKKNNE
jgi:hypothetical protein